MSPIVLGSGIAPDVTIWDGFVYVAYGAKPDALVLVTLTLAGVEMTRTVLPFGFDQSFPRFSGLWLVYRQDEAHGFAATAYNIRTGQTWPFTAAGATFGLTVNAGLSLAAYEWKRNGEPWRIWFGNLDTGTWNETAIEGAPDGLDQILSPNRVTLRKDTRGDVQGIWYPVRAGHLTVGELRDDPNRPNGGIGVQLAGDVLRGAMLAQNTPDPRCATDGTVYALVCWGGAVRLLLASEADLRALPPVVGAPAPQPPSTPPVPVPPQEPSMPVAPNKLTALQAIAAAHPEINRLADGPFAPNRGGITQLAAVQFGFPFGRKSRDGSQTNLSDDALCYRTQGSLFEIYDILSGGDGSVQWDYAGTFADGQNGFFVVPAGAPTPIPIPVPVPSPQPVPADLSALVARIAAAEAAQKRDHALLVQAIESLEILKARPATPQPLYRVVGRTSRGGWPGHTHGLEGVILEPIV